MKKVVKLFSIVGLSVIGLTGYSQTWSTGTGILYTNPATTKVGIGTTSPAARLHINNGNLSDAVILATATEDNKLIVRSETTQPAYCPVFRLQHSFLDNRNNGYINFYRGGSTHGGFLSFGTDGLERMIITATGNVGIGISPSSSYKLDVNGSIRANQVTIPASGTFAIGYFTQDNFTYDQKTLAHYSLGWYSDSWNQSSPTTLWMSSYGGIKFFTSGAMSMAINKNGNVGIGTTNPQSKLAVNGTISTKEVIVTLTGWSDFVFDTDYKLLSLHELEQFIKENKHLPEIPSAKEVEENGIHLGEMQAKFLQKIEELTLHAIEQQKLIEELQKRLSELENKKGGE